MAMATSCSGSSSGSGRTLSKGRTYEQRCASLGESWPSSSTCVWPTAQQADAISEILLNRSLRVVSIGCGDGAFEACLEERNISVCGVDADVISNTETYLSMPCFLSEGIRRVRPDALFHIDEDERGCCLCFVWGRSLPWREYMRQYSSTALVCIAGELATRTDEEVATEPAANALDGEEDGHSGLGAWRLLHRAPIRAVHRGAVLSVFERIQRVSR